MICLSVYLCLSLSVRLFVDFENIFAGRPKSHLFRSFTKYEGIQNIPEPTSKCTFLPTIILYLYSCLISKYVLEYVMLCAVFTSVLLSSYCLQLLFTSSLVVCPSLYQEIPAVIPVKCGPKSSSQSSATITFWYMLICI